MTEYQNGIMVSIRCTVYNHAKYLRQCLDGIISQKTDFRFEAIVHDDASTDGSREIIQEYANNYPDIIKPIFQKENQYSKDISIVRKAVTNQCRGKYIAWCEGDDYWIDPYKLQKQVDILESNSSIGLVYGKAKQFIENKSKFKKNAFGAYASSAKDLILSNTISTPTVAVRADIYQQYLSENDIQNQKWLMGDYPLWIYIAIYSDLYFINEELAVYRILQESACHSQNREKLEKFYKSALEMKKFFNRKYKIIDDSIIDNQYLELMLLNATAFGDDDEVLRLYSHIKNPQPIVKKFYILAKFHILFLYHLYKKVLS